jgi:peptidoglycan/LPS O-acetylase OafA/YrhL
MIRFFFRLLGLLCLAAAFILVIYDGTKSIAANTFYFTSVRTLWELINAASLLKLKPLLISYADGMLWDPGMVSLLAAPSWSLLGVLGIVFILLGRRKKPLIGYARSEGPCPGRCAARSGALQTRDLHAFGVR